MKPSGKICSFMEVLAALDITERQLKSLFSTGCIRAWREGDQMVFRFSDVEKLKELIEKNDKRVVQALNDGVKGDIYDAKHPSAPPLSFAATEPTHGQGRP